MKKKIIICIVLIWSIMFSLDMSDLEKTKWRDDENDYFIFHSDSTVIQYICGINEEFYGKYYVKNDTLVIEINRRQYPLMGSIQRYELYMINNLEMIPMYFKFINNGIVTEHKHFSKDFIYRKIESYKDGMNVPNLDGSMWIHNQNEKISLKFLDDSTFVYLDNSNNIQVNGEYYFEGDVLVLKENVRKKELIDKLNIVRAITKFRVKNDNLLKPIWFSTKSANGEYSEPERNFNKNNFYYIMQ